MKISQIVRLAMVISAGTLIGCGGGGGSGDGDDNSVQSGCLGELQGLSVGQVSAAAFGVSGVIEIESRTRVDSDTADDLRLGQATSNDCDNEAQALPVTGVAGGYLSSGSGSYPLRAGESVPFGFESDTQDYYTAELESGDRVSLQVFADPRMDEPQPRLQVFDGSDRLVFDSDNVGGVAPFVHVIDSAAGRYLLRVSTSSGGPFRYVVIAADKNALSVMNTAYTEPEFVPGEVVVTGRDRDVSAVNASAMAIPGSAASARELRPGVWHLRRSDLRSMAATDRAQARAATMDWVRRLQDRPEIALASPNYLYHAQTTSPESNPLYERQWHHRLISLPVAWQIATNAGAGVGVAVLDTGLFSTQPNTIGDWHPDLQANVLPFPGQNLDFVTGDIDLDNESGPDENPADPGDGQSRSSNFHGTHVAGIVAARDNTQGVVGVAHLADLIPLRVLGEAGTGSLDDLIEAIDWAASQGEIDVINLSLGAGAGSQQLEDAVNAAHNAGKLVVAAAGNQGTDTAVYPAAYANVVGVGAVDANGVRASYSNIGMSVDLVAPGGDASRDANLDSRADLVTSAWGTDEEGEFVPGYVGLQGTSMAAPHVAGVFALMKSEHTSLTSGDFLAFLETGDLTDDVGQATEYGKGLINAVKAMDAALSGSTPDILAASPSVLTFDTTSLEQQLDLIRYPASADITVTAVDTGEDWVEVGADLAAGAPLPASVTVTINTDRLAPAQNGTAVLRIDYRGDGVDRTLSVGVNVLLLDPEDTRNAGRHYVLLVSADGDQQTSYQTVVSANGGLYSFAFDSVATGSYFLVAGTDMDNNGFICESGEACAEYPVNGLPEPIEVTDGSLDSLRMTTSFRRPTISSLGGPRVGFDGYRLKTDRAESDKPLRRLEEQR